MSKNNNIHSEGMTFGSRPSSRKNKNDEWAEGHVPNAHHIPMNEVANQVDKLDDGARIFIICRSGGRSMTVANYLEAQGFDVVSVAGGTQAWIASNRELSFDASL